MDLFLSEVQGVITLLLIFHFQWVVSCEGEGAGRPWRGRAMLDGQQPIAIPDASVTSIDV